VAGDEVIVASAGLAVNGRSVPASRVVPRDAAGRPLPHPAFGGCRVRPGELWLFAPYHPRSYDSRYFGPVATAAVRGRLLPLAVANDDRIGGFQLHRFHASVLPAAPR
jgi:type IV secretory pathway protease TraF